MKHLKIFESFYETTCEKSNKLMDLETNLTDILDDLKIDGFEWLGFTQEAGSFGITSVDVNIYTIDKNKESFKFEEIENTMSHLHSYLSEEGFKLTGFNIVISMNKKSLDLGNERDGITYVDFSDACVGRDIKVLKLGFKPL